MSSLHTCLAIGPLAVYFLLLGLINLSRRPFMTTGVRDLYAVGIAIAGVMIVGPLDLFMPDAAARRWGPWAWVFLLALYILGVTLMVLMMRPRLIIYNFTVDQLRPVLAKVISRQGLEHQWAGESLALPTLGVQLQLDKFPVLRNVALVATAADQSYQGWRMLERELGAELRSIEVEPNPIGVVMVTTSLLLLAGSFVWLLVTREVVAQGVMEMLRL